MRPKKNNKVSVYQNFLYIKQLVLTVHLSLFKLQDFSLSSVLQTVSTRGGGTRAINNPQTSSDYTSEQKTAIVKDVVDNSRCQLDVCNKTKISSSALSRWVNTYKDQQGGGIVLPSISHNAEGGRPCHMSTSRIADLQATLLSNVKNNKAPQMSSSYLAKQVSSIIKGSEKDRGFATTNKQPTQYQQRQLKQSVISAVKGRSLSVARDKAMHNPRNAIRHAVMTEAVCKDLAPRNVGNCDGTTFEIGPDGKGLKLGMPKGYKGEVRRTGDTNQSVYIKYECIAFANGYCAPSIFVVADSTLSEDDLLHFEIKGLTHETAPNASGHLFVAHSRAANPKFFEWLLLHIGGIIESINGGVDEPETSSNDDSPFGGWGMFDFDGEQQQIAAGMSQEVLDLYDKLKTILTKFCASLSLIQQPLDTSDIFSGGKKANATATAEDYGDPILEALLIQTFKDPRLGMSTVYSGRLVTGLLRAVFALRKVVTPTNVINGFKRSGLIGSPSTWKEEVRSIPFSQLPDALTNSDYAPIESNFDVMKEHFVKTGWLSDAYLDSLDIIKAPDYVGTSDHKVLYQQGTTILNHTETVKRVVERKEKIEEEEAQKEQRKAAKAVLTEKQKFTLPVLTSIKDVVEAGSEKIKSAETEITIFSGDRSTEAREAREKLATMKVHLKAIKHEKAEAQTFHASGNLVEIKLKLISAKVSFESLDESYDDLVELAENFQPPSPKRAASPFAVPIQEPVYPLSGPPSTSAHFAALKDFMKAQTAWNKAKASIKKSKSSSSSSAVPAPPPQQQQQQGSGLPNGRQIRQQDI
jgi:transposase-like protein